MITQTKRKTKIALIISMIALVTAVFPMSNAFAEGMIDQETPTDTMQGRRISLARIWKFQQRNYVHLGKQLERTDQFIVRIQERTDTANRNGKDTTAIQAALDVFKQANNDALLIHQKGEAIINAHVGFDADGVVIDRTLAVESIESLADITRETRNARRDPFRLLRDALRSFREANPISTTPNP